MSGCLASPQEPFAKLRSSSSPSVRQCGVGVCVCVCDTVCSCLKMTQDCGSWVVALRHAAPSKWPLSGVEPRWSKDCRVTHVKVESSERVLHQVV